MLSTFEHYLQTIESALKVDNATEYTQQPTIHPLPSAIPGKIPPTDLPRYLQVLAKLWIVVVTFAGFG